MIPQADPRRRFQGAWAQLRKAHERVFESGEFILGAETIAFENEYAEFLGASHAVSVGSGTDAIALALVACGIEAGDEVLTVSLTAAGTVVGIVNAGGIPRFVDVDSETRCIDLASVSEAINSKTKAIVPVHLHGFPAPISQIISLARRHGLVVVEDCAQAHGAQLDGRFLGTFGDASAFSFYPTKNLGGAGDGGAVVTNDPMIARTVRQLRQYGWDDERNSVRRGFNSRLGELQAAYLRVLLGMLQRQTEQRRAIAAEYRRALTCSPVKLPLDVPGAVYHQFAIEYPDRDNLKSYLAQKGIGTGVHYPLGVHQQAAYLTTGLSLPVTEGLASTLLSLPIQPEVAGPNIETICAALQEGIERCAR